MSEPIPLSKPILAHGEEVRQITLREPTGDDICTAGGLPFAIVSGDNSPAVANFIHLNPMAATEMIAVLASIPPSAVRSMAGRDWHRCAMAVVDFFGAAPPA